MRAWSLALVLFSACGREQSSSAPPSQTTPHAAEAGVDPDARADAAPRARIDSRSPRVASWDLPFAAKEVVAGAAPSDTLPRGTLVFAREAEEGFAVVEWDLARARALREKIHSFEPGQDFSQVGNTSAFSRAGSGFVYATTGYEDPSPIELWVLDATFAKAHHQVIDVPSWDDGRRIALHASGDTVALSYCARRRGHVATFDVRSGKPIGRRTLGARLTLCVGFATPLADVRVVDGTVWIASASRDGYELLGLSRDLRRTVARHRVATPGQDQEAFRSAVSFGNFPRFDASRTRFAWNSHGAIAVSNAASGQALWEARLDPASLPDGPVHAPEAHAIPIAVDPGSGAAFLGDGTWYSPDGTASRLFHIIEEQPPQEPMPVFYKRRVTFAHGRGVFLDVAHEHSTLVLVEPS